MSANLPEGTREVGHRTQLDGLRGLAVALVLVQHLGGPSVLVARTGPGGLGVSLFFVLSGYLVTSLLIDARDTHGQRCSLRSLLGVFYARRWLRIAPLYWLVLGIAALAGVPAVRHAWLWHVSYLSNVYFALKSHWDGPTTPLWSLALEEQFYLLWPIAVFALSRRRLFALTCGLVALGPVFRLVIWLALGPSPFWLLLLPGYIDQLALGALMAQRAGAVAPERVRVHVLLGFAAFMVWAVFVFVAPREGTLVWGLQRVAQPLIVALGAATLVFSASRGSKLLWGKFLDTAALRALGTVSYGVYLLHAFVHNAALGLSAIPGLAVLAPLLRWLHADAWRWFGVSCLTVVVIASLSYRLVEKPILTLKSRFRYALLAAKDPVKKHT
ncbi:MAG: acyltransferase [Deltaproteobacteria bacterium]|nr:acyltransferase [Deltaproteobacteria bacterium]